MQAASCLICWCLLAQLPPGRTPAPPAQDDSAREEPAQAAEASQAGEAAGPLVPVNTPRPEMSPPRLMAAALTPPERQPLEGRPLPLLEVLTRVSGRSRQLEAVRSYWKVTAAVAAYHFARDEYDHFQALAATMQPGSSSQSESLAENLLALELASAAARLRDAELAALNAQAEMAHHVGLAPGDPLPLPLDMPHLGSYRTYFDVLFASRPAAPRLRLLDRTMPLRRQAIDVRAESVQAAIDAVEAVRDLYRRGEVPAEDIAAALVELGAQRQGFLMAVRAYNDEIAEYALAVASETASPPALLAMLVKPRPAAGPAKSSDTTPATPNAAVDPNAAAAPARPLPGQGSGRLNIPPAESPGPPGTQPPGTQPPGTQSPRPANPSTPGSSEPRSIRATPDAGEARSLLDPNRKPTRRLKPLSELEPSADEGVVQATHLTEPADQAMYAGLMVLSAPKRTHRLTALMHWDRSLPAVGKPTTLAEFLAGASGSERQRLIAAYWQARELAARYQSLSDRNDQLAMLLPTVLRSRTQSGGAEAMVQLRSLQLDAQADLLEAEAALLAARHELTALAGKPGAMVENWLMPATPPHGGRYSVNREALASAATAPGLENLTTTIPALHGILSDQAEVVLRSDAHRAAVSEAFERGQTTADEVLESIQRQSEESQRFLSVLTRYNVAIADYALTVLPPSAGAVQLTAALVVRKQ